MPLSICYWPSNWRLSHKFIDCKSVGRVCVQRTHTRTNSNTQCAERENQVRNSVRQRACQRIAAKFENLPEKRVWAIQVVRYNFCCCRWNSSSILWTVISLILWTQFERNLFQFRQMLTEKNGLYNGFCNDFYNSFWTSSNQARYAFSLSANVFLVQILVRILRRILIWILMRISIFSYKCSDTKSIR